MPNQQLVDYIKKSRQTGAEDSAIRQALLGSGYSAQDVEEAITGAGAGPNILERIQNQKPPAYESSPAKPPGKSFRPGIKTLVIFLIIIAGLIGGYFVLTNYFPQYAKYVQPYVGPVLDPALDFINSVTSNLPFIGGAPYNSDNILKAFEKSALIDSARYNATVYIETQDKEPNLKPLVVKIPKGEVPQDLKNAIGNYRVYNYDLGTLTGSPNPDTTKVIELTELKSALDAKALDDGKIVLASEVLDLLDSYYRDNNRDPASINELVSLPGQINTGGVDYWAQAEGKYFNYNPAPDLKSFELSITLNSEGSVNEFKKRIESIKNLYYKGKEFKDDSVRYEGTRVIFNHKFIPYAYHLSYLNNNPSSTVESFAGLFSDGSSGGYLSYIPGSFKLNLNVGGIMQSKDSKSFYIQLGGKADFEDLVVEADVEFTNVDKESFFRINKFPSIFMDVSKVREEWIKLPTASKSSADSYSDADIYSSYAGSVQDNITEYREKNDRNFEQLRKITSIAEQEKIITATGSPVKEKVGDRTAYKYLVTIDENKLASFYEKAVVELKEYGADAMIREDELNRLFFNSNGLKEIIRYLKDTSDFNVWVDTNGYIIKYQYDIKYVPYVSSESQSRSNKQFYISAGIELSDINKNLEVERPEKYIEWKEALSKLFGLTEEAIGDAQAESRDAMRMAYVNQLRVAAELYFDDHGGAYPTALSIANLKEYLSSSDVPKDPVTGKPYNYAYYPANKPTKFHIWTQLENKSAPALSADLDLNSDLSGWMGNKINASQPGSESCTAPYNNDAARDCIYDQGQK